MRRRSSLITRIRCARRLDQQDMHFPTRHRPVLDPGGYNKNLAGAELTVRSRSSMSSSPLSTRKKIVRVVMLMPVEWSFELRHHNVVVVVSRNRARRETVAECRQLFGKVCRCFHRNFPWSSCSRSRQRIAHYEVSTGALVMNSHRLIRSPRRRAVVVAKERRGQAPWQS